MTIVERKIHGKRSRLKTQSRQHTLHNLIREARVKVRNISLLSNLHEPVGTPRMNQQEY